MEGPCVVSGGFRAEARTVRVAIGWSVGSGKSGGRRGRSAQGEGVSALSSRMTGASWLIHRIEQMCHICVTAGYDLIMSSAGTIPSSVEADGLQGADAPSDGVAAEPWRGLTDAAKMASGGLAAGEITPETVLETIGRLESMRAILDAMTTSLTGVLADHCADVATAAAVAERPDASPSAVARARVDARASLVDEIVLVTGLPGGQVHDLVELAAAPQSRVGALHRHMQAGVAGRERVRTVWRATADLPDDAVTDITDRVFAPPPGGGTVSHALFRRRLSRLIARYTDTERRRRRTADERDCRLDAHPDGGGTLSLTGPFESLVGAYERIEHLARAMRRAGDPRPLTQLRFDIGAGLLVFGQPTRVVADDGTGGGPRSTLAGEVASESEHSPRKTSPTGTAEQRETTAFPGVDPEPAIGSGSGEGRSPGAPSPTGVDEQRETPTLPRASSESRLGAGNGRPATTTDATVSSSAAEKFAASFDLAFPPVPLPVAHVSVVVSAASLLGLTDDPGEIAGHGFVGAHSVRSLAHVAGSTWRRLITDPVTGYSVATVSPAYTPPPRMARVVRDRDHHCRFPGCTRPAGRCDLDHVREYPDGPTAVDNLQTLHRGHHQRKTTRLWRAAMTSDGSVTWTTPLGRVHTTRPFDYRADFGNPSDVPTGASGSADLPLSDGRPETGGVSGSVDAPGAAGPGAARPREGEDDRRNRWDRDAGPPPF